MCIRPPTSFLVQTPTKELTSSGKLTAVRCWHVATVWSPYGRQQSHSSFPGVCSGTTKREPYRTHSLTI
jgi:hypothetical protein